MAAVVYDADVLSGNTLRDLLVRIAQAGMVQGASGSWCGDGLGGCLC